MLAYLLVHVEYQAGVPKIVFESELERGALNATTLEAVELTDHRPLIFINACASAGLRPHSRVWSPARATC